jgi:MFS family permease
VILFFSSAAASSAYLTASEIFPLETRALAIACFYAVGTAIGGALSPVLFGSMIGTGSRAALGLAMRLPACCCWLRPCGMASRRGRREKITGIDCRATVEPYGPVCIY